MTDLEDATARVHSAEVMHRQLCEAKDRGEPVDWLLKSAHAEWVAARETLAALADGVVASLLLQQHNADAPGDVA